MYILILFLSGGLALPVDIDCFFDYPTLGGNSIRTRA